MQAPSNGSTSLTAAILGTGIIGSAMARNLQRAGYCVQAWNRTRERAAPLAADGIGVADTPAQAVGGADVVLTVLKDGDSVRAAIEAAAPGLRRGALWLQMSTVGERAAIELGDIASRLGLIYVDAPVLGTKGPAEQGQLTVLASGPGSGNPLASQVFDTLGKRTVRLGEEAGAASRLKLVLNAWVFALNHGVAETLALAEGLGVPGQLVAEVVRGSVLDTPFFHAKAAAIGAGDYRPSFSVENAIKDTRLILSSAETHRLRLDLTEAGLHRLERAKEGGHGEDDMAASFLASRAGQARS